MSRFNESELSRKIDDTIVAHLQTGEPTADEVSQDVLTQYDDLIREYGHELAVSQIRSIVSGRMKKILATRKGNALQLRLSLKFGDLEPESAITFRDDDDTFSNVKAKRDEAQRKINLAKARGVPVVVVINYDSAWRTPFAEWALKQKWDLVVADEIHRCKAPGGKASRFLARLGKAARFRLGLSGTPMPHSPLDVYGYFRFIDATIFGWSYNRFRQHFAVMGG